MVIQKSVLVLRLDFVELKTIIKTQSNQIVDNSLRDQLEAPNRQDMDYRLMFKMLTIDGERVRINFSQLKKLNVFNRTCSVS